MKINWYCALEATAWFALYAFMGMLALGALLGLAHLITWLLQVRDEYIVAAVVVIGVVWAWSSIYIDCVKECKDE